MKSTVIAPPGVEHALSQLSKSVLIDLIVSRVLEEKPRAKPIEVCETLDAWLVDVYDEREEKRPATLKQYLRRYRDSAGSKKPPKSWERFMKD